MSRFKNQPLIGVCIVVSMLFCGSCNSSQHEVAEKSYSSAAKPEHLSELQTNEIPTLLTVENDSDPLLSQINHYLSQLQFNGAAAIYHQGKLIFNKGYGIRDFSTGEANDANSMFLIGSAQKFTTGLILKQLELEHKIDINDAVTKYLPEFQMPKPLKLKHLMLHSGGLLPFKPNEFNHSLADAVETIRNNGMDVRQSGRFYYSDANYLVLSRIIEIVTNQSFAENFNTRIKAPFKLTTTAFFNDPDYQTRMAKGYYDHYRIITQAFPIGQDAYYGAGNLYMTPLDMGKLFTAFQQYKIFSPQVTEEMLHSIKTKAYPFNYRYGFYSYPVKNRLHGAFYRNVFTVYANEEYTVVLGSNYEPTQTNNEAKVRHIFHHILKQSV
ncbi:serine hydrolase domain-containing protein [Staphylococcus auricularis]|uniref:Serine hydrolase domain-containing protein n=1 Tax=Staphylococcus auricularis TaxID=29379 RepID=A0AAW7M700_9STAP|nr:serine hydrolase domain-containing protein [Staphylococcus auricularis]MDC6326355.1 serine hydrolase [Staphylococcus auricularis]MDN4532232.1 serine hydrolase domain-containing protein [Staphylococcus auricularis]